MKRQFLVVLLVLAACAPSKPAAAPANDKGWAKPGLGLGAAPVTGYTGGPVTSGGSIKGRVTFAGRPSKPKPVKCARDSDVCGRPRLDQRLTVGASGGLANVIVSLTDIHAGKSLPAKSVAKLAIKACNYSPRVLAVPLGTHLLVSNRDPIPHDFNGSRGDRVLFNRQVLTDQERLDMSVPGILNLDCDMHDPGSSCESGVIGVMQSPYYALTKDDGAFEMTDVPPGTYTLQAWHETLGQQSRQVTVPPNGSVGADFAFAAKR